MPRTIVQPRINNIDPKAMQAGNSQEKEFEIISLKDFFSGKNLKDSQKCKQATRNMILIITSGLGKHIIDFKDHQFTNGSIIFVAEGQVHKFEYKPGNSGYIVFFSKEFMINNDLGTSSLSQTWLYNYHVNAPMIQVNAKMREHFFDIIEKMYQEFESNSTYAKEDVIKTLLYLLLLKSERIKRDLISKDALKWSDIIFNFIDLAEKVYFKSRNADYFAKQMNISYKHLNNICKQALNKTAKSFIDDYIILVAKRLLMCSDITVKEITSRTGFDEPTNFVKYFRKHTGSSPIQFRKQFSKSSFV